MTLEFSITVEPLVMLLIACTIIALYAIKRGYNRSKIELDAKLQQGRGI